MRLISCCFKKDLFYRTIFSSEAFFKLFFKIEYITLDPVPNWMVAVSTYQYEWVKDVPPLCSLVSQVGKPDPRWVWRDHALAVTDLHVGMGASAARYSTGTTEL